MLVGQSARAVRVHCAMIQDCDVSTLEGLTMVLSRSSSNLPICVSEMFHLNNYQKKDAKNKTDPRACVK